MKRQVLIAACAAFAILATISTATETGEAGVGAGGGRIILYRGQGYEGIVNPFITPDARLDGQLVGQCVKGRKITLPAAPGSHTISTTSESANDITFSVAEGQTVCVKCTIAVGVIVPNFSLKIVDDKKCQKVVDRYKELK